MKKVSQLVELYISSKPLEWLSMKVRMRDKNLAAPIDSENLSDLLPKFTSSSCVKNISSDAAVMETIEVDVVIDIKS